MAQPTTRDLIELHLARLQHLTDTEIVTAIAAVPRNLVSIIKQRAAQLEEVESLAAIIINHEASSWGMF